MKDLVWKSDSVQAIVLQLELGQEGMVNSDMKAWVSCFSVCAELSVGNNEIDSHLWLWYMGWGN